MYFSISLHFLYILVFSTSLCGLVFLDISDFVFWDPSVLAFSKKHSPVLHSVLASTLYSFLCLLLPCLYSCALSISSLFTTFCHLPNGHWQLEIHSLKSHWNYSDFHMYFFQMYFFSQVLFPHILLQMYFCTHVLLTNVVLQSSLAEWQVVTRIAEKTANVTFLPILPRYNLANLAISTIPRCMPWLPFPRLK